MCFALIVFQPGPLSLLTYCAQSIDILKAEQKEREVKEMAVPPVPS